MRQAVIFVNGARAGILYDHTGQKYSFVYDRDYSGEPVSLTMPLEKERFEFDSFPPFFDGLLPEGIMLDALLKKKKIDKNDLFEQLVNVGNDLVGAVTVREIRSNVNDESVIELK